VPVVTNLVTLAKLDATGWELYHVAEDFAETKNVAAENRDRLIAMIACGQLLAPLRNG
jgi:arylsulfatase A-like enzyme